MKEIRLFSYKMTHDNGFAPNPFQGFMTLANCKPYFRKYKKVNDWIAGFTSKKLNNEIQGEEKLVYLMKVTRKVTYEEYWNNPEYECKKPINHSLILENKAGDNIYKPNKELASGFEKITFYNHLEDYLTSIDLSGQNVLISEYFYYFGGKPISIPKEFRPEVPKSQSAHGKRTYNIDTISLLLNYLESKYCMGIINLPLDWPEVNINESLKIKKCK